MTAKGSASQAVLSGTSGSLAKFRGSAATPSSDPPYGLSWKCLEHRQAGPGASVPQRHAIRVA